MRRDWDDSGGRLGAHAPGQVAKPMACLAAPVAFGEQLDEA